MGKRFESDKVKDWENFDEEDVSPWNRYSTADEELEEEEDENWDEIAEFDKRLRDGNHSLDGNISEDDEDDDFEVDGNANVPLDDNEEPSQEDEMDNLCYLLRKFFTMSRTEAEVSYRDGIIDVFCFFERKEKMSSIMRAFEVVDKLKRDTLQGYSSTFEMWENREGFPVFNFRFAFGDALDDGMDNDSAPDEDDAPWGDQAHNANLQGNR